MKYNPLVQLANNFRFSRSEYALSYHLGRLYDGIDCNEKSLLDIGSGHGVFSLYALYLGARRVVGLEPNGNRIFQRFARDLSLNGAELVRSTFQDYQVDNQFDIILLHNALHHLNERACIDLLSNSDARDTYGGLLRKVYNALKPGGTIILVDASGHNLWNELHVRNPFVPSICWDGAYRPEVWATLLEEVGFLIGVSRGSAPRRYINWDSEQDSVSI